MQRGGKLSKITRSDVRALFRVHAVSTFVSEGMSDPRYPTPEEEAEIAPLLEQRAAASDALRRQIAPT